MRIKVKMDGHQIYKEITGNVISWGSTVESFDGKPFQVPCVVLETEDRVEVVPLSASHLSFRIEAIEALSPILPKKAFLKRLFSFLLRSYSVRRKEPDKETPVK